MLGQFTPPLCRLSRRGKAMYSLGHRFETADHIITEQSVRNSLETTSQLPAKKHQQTDKDRR